LVDLTGGYVPSGHASQKKALDQSAFFIEAIEAKDY
jgi:hypothetical protein